jgi:hypothetical protein
MSTNQMVYESKGERRCVFVGMWKGGKVGGGQKINVLVT